jgi:NgoFVII C-terminal B3-like DNA-binding domain
MISFAQQDIANEGKYLKFLEIFSNLSNLFSDSKFPYLHYRIIENLFCRCYDADNLSRSDTAFDASIGNLGIGLKTFTITSENSREKVAEFNKLFPKIKHLDDGDFIKSISQFRNDRISLAKRLYNIDKSIYHIVGRRENEIVLFETDYDEIKIDSLEFLDKSKASIFYTDTINEYSFNFSKSTLFRKFQIPNNIYSFPVEILNDPYDLLFELIEYSKLKKAKEEYVILPLYGRGRKVFDKSGLNAWNAGGRKRDPSEMYIPNPAELRALFPDFFPPIEESFELITPTKDILVAKICQQGGKALMTNPNKAISDWLLRKVLLLKNSDLATIEHLDNLGFDSVRVTKLETNKFNIDIATTGSYEKFMESFQYR